MASVVEAMAWLLLQLELLNLQLLLRVLEELRLLGVLFPKLSSCWTMTRRIVMMTRKGMRQR